MRENTRDAAQYLSEHEQNLGFDSDGLSHQSRTPDINFAAVTPYDDAHDNDNNEKDHQPGSYPQARIEIFTAFGAGVVGGRCISVVAQRTLPVRRDGG